MYAEVVDLKPAVVNGKDKLIMNNKPISYGDFTCW